MSMVRITVVALFALMALAFTDSGHAQSTTFEVSGSYDNTDVGGDGTISGFITFDDIGTATNYDLDFGGGAFTFDFASADAYDGVTFFAVDDFFGTLTSSDGSSFLTLDSSSGNELDDGLNVTSAKIALIERVSNPTPAIPEPSTWLMMLAGFAVTGIALRRRSTVALAA